MKNLDDVFKDFIGGLQATVTTVSTQLDVYIEDHKQMVAEVHVPGFNKLTIPFKELPKLKKNINRQW